MRVPGLAYRASELNLFVQLRKIQECYMPVCLTLHCSQINKYAFSGGRATIEEHRTRGADLEVSCVRASI